MMKHESNVGDAESLEDGVEGHDDDAEGHDNDTEGHDDYVEYQDDDAERHYNEQVNMMKISSMKTVKILNMFNKIFIEVKYTLIISDDVEVVERVV